MAYAGQQFQYEAMLTEERLDTPLICGCCFSAGICCDFHGSIYPDLPPQPSTTQLQSSFDDDEAWTTNDSGSFLDSYQYSSSSSVHSFGQASTDASSVSEESSSSSSEDEKFLHRSKPCRQDSAHEQKYPSSLRSWGQISQNCNESLSVEALPINEAHSQFISPAMLISANQTTTDHEAKPKKRQRTQEKPEMVQPYRNTNAEVQSAEPTRINLLDPQILLKTQSSEKQALLHQLLGIYAEFTSPLNPQSLRAFEGLAALLNRLVKDWLHKPSHLECLKDRDGIPIPPAARDPCSPFACVCGCGYTSPRLIDLERHLSQNWLASYWQCPLCDKRFDRRDMLSAHLRSKKHSGSGEKVNEERDFHRNGCDDEFTKRCGFCGEVCKGFKVFTRHIGKHFRGTSSEPPKSMRDWRDTRDDDDDDSNSDDGKGAGRTGKPNNNGGRHDRGGGSNGGGSNGGGSNGGGSNGDTSSASKGGEHDSSKGSGHSRGRGTKRGNNRSGHSSAYNSIGSGFKAFDSSSTDGSLALSDTALPFSVPQIGERRKAGKLPLRSKKVGKQPQKPPMAESIIDTVEAPVLTTQNAFPQVSGPPRRDPQSSEVIFDAAERWKAFRLKYESFILKTQDMKRREPSSSSPSRGGPGRLYAHEDRPGSVDGKVKQHTQSIKNIDDSMIDRASADEALQVRYVSNATRKTKQRKRSRHRIRAGNANTQGGSRNHLAKANPCATYKLSDKNGKISHADSLDLMQSDARVPVTAENLGKIMRASAGGTRAQGEDTFDTIDDWMSKYKELDIVAQKYVSEHLYDINQRHQESSWRSGPGIPQKRHAPIFSERSRQQATLAKPSRGTLEGFFFEHKHSQSGPVLPPDPHAISSLGVNATTQPAQLQSVQNPRSKDHGKHHSGFLESPTLDASESPGVMAPPQQPVRSRSSLSTLASGFATINADDFADCQKIIKQRPEILDDDYRLPERPCSRYEFGRHRQQLGRIIPIEDWESLRTEITRLYRDERRTLSEVMEHMSERYCFQATAMMYKKKISAWNIRRARAVSSKLKRETENEALSATTATRGHRTEYAAIFLIGGKTDALYLHQRCAEIITALKVNNANANGPFEPNLMERLGWRRHAGKSRSHMLRFEPPEIRLAAPLSGPCPQMVFKIIKDCRSSSSEELTSISGLKDHLQQFYIGEYLFVGKPLATLHARSFKQAPHNWKRHWNDTRNLPAWMALWAVIVFGGGTLLLQTIQLILQLLQT